MDGIDNRMFQMTIIRHKTCTHMGPYSPTILRNILCITCPSYYKFESNATSDWLNLSQSENGLANQQVYLVKVLENRTKNVLKNHW